MFHDWDERRVETPSRAGRHNRGACGVASQPDALNWGFGLHVSDATAF
jgi:hypothetical protein